MTSPTPGMPRSRVAGDPLLAMLRVIVIVLIAILAIGSGAMLLAAPLVLLFHDPVLASLGPEWTTAGIGALLIIALLLTGLGAVCALVTQVFRLLLRIIDTVRDGDPFIPDNAERLSRMAWLATIAYAVGLMLAIPALWLENWLGPEGGFKVEAHADGSAILLILILFVLARVFRQGAAMRAELEATV